MSFVFEAVFSSYFSPFVLRALCHHPLHFLGFWVLFDHYNHLLLTPSTSTQQQTPASPTTTTTSDFPWKLAISSSLVAWQNAILVMMSAAALCWPRPGWTWGRAAFLSISNSLKRSAASSWCHDSAWPTVLCTSIESVFVSLYRNFFIIS